MASKYGEIDTSGFNPKSIKGRASKVSIEQFAGSPGVGKSMGQFIDSLPDILAGRLLRDLASSIANAHRNGKPVIACMGAHVIKCGLSPVIIELMSKRILTTVATNGAGAIHDSEIALFGVTSEDVAEGLKQGNFGASKETAEFINQAVSNAYREKMGLGESVGRSIAESDAPYARASILAAGYQLGIPVTVHVAIGTDITHMHPGADGAAYGDASMRDFRILVAAMKHLGSGGVLLNLGSAVILPEVVLKGFAMLRNMGYDFSGMVGANLDFVQHYRSSQQVVARVELLGGRGIALTGHHEIMIPLLAHAVLEEVCARTPGSSGVMEDTQD